MKNYKSNKLKTGSVYAKQQASKGVVKRKADPLPKPLVPDQIVNKMRLNRNFANVYTPYHTM